MQGKQYIEKKNAISLPSFDLVDTSIEDNIFLSLHSDLFGLADSI